MMYLLVLSRFVSGWELTRRPPFPFAPLPFCPPSTLQPDYIRAEILPEFFKHFWVRRMAADRRNYKQVVETTVEIANKVGSSEIVGRIVEDLKDESEAYRRMVMETIEKVVEALGTADIDARLEELLVDGILYAFQEQTAEDASAVMLGGFGTVVNALGQRVKPYLPQIAGTIKWRLNNKVGFEGGRAFFFSSFFY